MPLKVLVVDDESMYRHLLQKTLVTEGYQVDVAEDGYQAVEQIKNNDYDIVLTDLAMPHVGGIEVLKEAKKKNESTIVIIITGYASLDTALAAIKDGVYDYITKPFQLDEIRLTMKNAGGHLWLENQNRLLLAKLDEAYQRIEQLSNNRREYESKISEIDQQLADRQNEINESMKRLKGFHDRVLPVQFTNGNKAESESDSYLRLMDAVKLRNEGIITEQEFLLLKRKILKE